MGRPAWSVRAERRGGAGNATGPRWRLMLPGDVEANIRVQGCWRGRGWWWSRPGAPCGVARALGGHGAGWYRRKGLDNLDKVLAARRCAQSQSNWCRRGGRSGWCRRGGRSGWCRRGGRSGCVCGRSPAGVTRVAGPAGVAGVASPAGVAGVAGPAGVAGVAGPAGVAELAGPAGVSGVAGPAGVAGVAGPAGVAEVAGPAGVAGVAGPAGVAGVAGPAGVAGVAGPAGCRTGVAGPAELSPRWPVRLVIAGVAGPATNCRRGGGPAGVTGVVSLLALAEAPVAGCPAVAAGVAGTVSVDPGVGRRRGGGAVVGGHPRGGVHRPGDELVSAVQARRSGGWGQVAAWRCPAGGVAWSTCPRSLDEPDSRRGCARCWPPGSGRAATTRWRSGRRVCSPGAWPAPARPGPGVGAAGCGAGHRWHRGGGGMWRGGWRAPGAEHLVLAGRRGRRRPARPVLAAELAQAGVAVTVAACDTADRDALAGVLGRIGARGRR